MISPESNESNVSAEITLEQESAEDVLRIRGQIRGLSPGLYGFHVHENSDTSDNCMAAGGHYNPGGVSGTFSHKKVRQSFEQASELLCQTFSSFFRD